jgi:hypothetical protein
MVIRGQQARARLDQLVIRLQLLQQQRSVLLIGNRCKRSSHVPQHEGGRVTKGSPSETLASRCAMFTALCSVASTRLAFACPALCRLRRDWWPMFSFSLSATMTCRGTRFSAAKGSMVARAPCEARPAFRRAAFALQLRGTQCTPTDRAHLHWLRLPCLSNTQIQKTLAASEQSFRFQMPPPPPLARSWGGLPND